MLTNNFENKNIMQLMGRFTCAHNGLYFFILGAGEIIFGFLVPNLFLTCSHHIPLRFLRSEVVLEDIPNRTSILSHMVCPKFNSHVYKLKR
jgi:hypothetical protein